MATLFKVLCGLMVLLGLAVPSCHAGATPVRVDSTITTLSLKGHLYANAPGAAPATVADALSHYRAGEFQHLPAFLGRGYRKEPVWLAFDLAVAADAPRILVVDVGPAYLDEVRAWQIDELGGITALGRAGDQVPPDEVVLRGLRPAFGIRPDEGGTILLQVRTSSTQAAIVKLHAAARYPALLATEGLVFGAIAAVNLVMAMGALALFLLFRDRAYLVWMAYVLLTCAQFLAVDGLLYLYSPSDALENVNLITNVLSVLLFATGGLLMTMLFQFGQIHPWLHRLFVGWAVAMIVPLCAIPFLGAWVVGVLGLLGLPLFVLGIVGVAVQILRGHRTSRLYGPMYIIHLLASLINVLAIVGLWPFSEFTLYGWQLTSLVNLLSLQVSMFMRMRQRLAEVEQQRRGYVLALNDKNAELEHQVNERTASLAQALRDVQQAESEQRQLLSMASHEFRTPAAMIKASLDSLRFLSSQISSDVRLRLKNIEHACTRMIDLSNNLIHQDRLREIALHPRRVPVDLQQLTADIVARYAHAAPDADGPRVLMDPVDEAARAHTVLQVDPSLISIALHNLIDNALRYGGIKGEGEPVRVGIERVPGHLELRVADRGPGIPDQEKSRIFQRFYSLGDARAASVQNAPRTHGDGLGLSVVSTIAQAHGGIAFAADNPGGGAVLVMRLPCADEVPPRVCD